MSYQALYRVWRPQNFDQLVGQSMIADTLKNAIKNEQLSHAYLFTGPRGTGKTSAAKILSKAVNCPHQVDGNPCNECEICQGITAGQVADVIEIDAASNNGVEEIRDLRDKVRYAPTQAAYKVYIIDEVHMLTTGAFNALLKTLEEPPAQVLFILATTEPHKIPATIMSRTQRFDFQRLRDRDIIAHMSHILDEYQVDYEEEALAIIARASNGGMRDSLSLLDQSLSFNNEEVTVATALQVSGSFDQITYVQYIVALYQREVEVALGILEEQLQAGKQASRFIEELILFSRDVLLTMHSSANKTLLSEAELQPLLDVVPASFYYTLIDGLNEAQNQMRFSNQPDLYLEVMTVQLVEQPSLQVTAGAGGSAGTPADDASVQALRQKIAELEEQLSQVFQQLKGQETKLDDLSRQSPTDRLKVAPLNEGDSAGKQVAAKKEEPLVPRPRPKSPGTAYRLRLQEVYNVLNVATRQHIVSMKQHWPVILNELTPQQRARLIGTQPLAAGPNHTLISFDNRQMCGLVQNDPMLKQMLENIASEKMGESTKLAFILASEWPQERQNYKLLHDRNGGQPVVIEDTEEEQEEEQEVQVVAEQTTSEAVTVDNHSAVKESAAENTQVSESDSVKQSDTQVDSSETAQAEQPQTSETREESSTNTDSTVVTEETQTVPTMRAATENIVQAAHNAFEAQQTAQTNDETRAIEAEFGPADESPTNFVDPSLEASDPEAGQQFAMPPEGHPAFANRETDTPETEDAVPLVISKALELFGSDRVNIIHEEPPTE